MNAQNDFLDNAVNGGFVVEGAEELNAKMCSYMQNYTEKMCSSLRNDTCGDGMCIGQQKQKAGRLP